MATLRLEAVTQFAPTPLVSATTDRDSKPIVNDISFTVPDGEFWVVVGPSGCGKSTILRLIAGLLPVSSGQVYIGDQSVNTVPARQRDVAMVFQNYALYPHMSVAQNLGFGLKMRGVTRAVRSQQVSEMAAALGLSDLLTRKPAELSGGQQQRVALGRALVRRPQVFLLDEPLSNLDTQLRDETRAELKQIHQRFGVTTLYVTHDQTEAMTLAEQLIVLDQGKIQQIAPPLRAYAEPENVTVAAFLGTPPMNLLTVQYRQTGLWLGPQLLADWTNPCVSDETKVILGIRAEQIRLSDTGVPVNVIAVEPLGRDILVQGQMMDGHPLCFFVTPEKRPQIDATLHVSLVSPLVIFDRETGDRLSIVR